MLKGFLLETVLVTGAAGFIGSSLTDRLLADGKRVVGLDNFSDFYSPKTKQENIGPALKHENFVLKKVDVRNFEGMKALFRGSGIEKVVHLAAQAGVRPSIENPFLYEDVNIKGTLNLLQLSRQFDVKNFLLASSSSVYGASANSPFSESAAVEKPVSPYAASKKACELFAFTYSHLYALPIIALRFFTVYGPRQRPDMAIYKFTKLIEEGKEIELYGSGQSRRDYTFIDDAVDGICRAIDCSFAFEVINLGNSSPISLNRLVSLLEEKLGRKAKIKALPDQAGDVPLTFADISKARRLLGYDPKVTIEDGIVRFVKWFKSKRQV